MAFIDDLVSALHLPNFLSTDDFETVGSVRETDFSRVIKAVLDWVQICGLSLRANRSQLPNPNHDDR